MPLLPLEIRDKNKRIVTLRRLELGVFKTSLHSFSTGTPLCQCLSSIFTPQSIRNKKHNPLMYTLQRQYHHYFKKWTWSNLLHQSNHRTLRCFLSRSLTFSKIVFTYHVAKQHYPTTGQRGRCQANFWLHTQYACTVSVIFYIPNTLI